VTIRVLKLFIESGSKIEKLTFFNAHARRVVVDLGFLSHHQPLLSGLIGL
jgi:hypothetical protein